MGTATGHQGVEALAARPVVRFGPGTGVVVTHRTEADITIPDTGTSRKHVEILWDGNAGQARDLGSTNGSKLNGQPFRQAALSPDAVIEIGRTRIVFRVVAQAAGSDRRMSDATRRHDVSSFSDSWGDGA